MSFIANIFASIGASAIVKIFRGIAGPILEHYQHKDRQETERMGIWSNALVRASEADVDLRRIAAQERANNPALMVIYVLILIGPVTYYLLFWMDTIFADQRWAINLYLFEIPIWDWTTFEVARAPERLEEMGKWIIGIFLGAGTASAGVVKGAKILRAAKMFRS